MTLYVVRHGETLNNVKGLVQGQNDSPLTEKGIEDAYKLKEEIKNLNIDVVISSPLKRAVDTAKIIAEGKIINIDSRLIERSWGLCEGANLNEVDRVNVWNYYLNTNENGIEKLWDVIERINDFIDDLKRRYKDENILIVTHSAISRCIYYHFNDIPEDGDMSKMDIKNLEILKYTI